MYLARERAALMKRPVCSLSSEALDSSSPTHVCSFRPLFGGPANLPGMEMSSRRMPRRLNLST